MDFDGVIKLYSDTVYRLAFARAGNSYDAEDITQEVFLRYIRAGKTFSDEEHRKAWLIRTAINTSVNVMKSAYKRRYGGEPDYNSENTATDDNIARLEDKSVVYNAVLKLPEKYRIVIHLFYYEDMKIERISEVTGIGINTVKSRLKRARDLLREELKEDFDEF